jgi:hypothetical protein
VALDIEFGDLSATPQDLEGLVGFGRHYHDLPGSR